jgi:hypothetical protein
LCTVFWSVNKTRAFKVVNVTRATTGVCIASSVGRTDINRRQIEREKSHTDTTQSYRVSRSTRVCHSLKRKDKCFSSLLPEVSLPSGQKCLEGLRVRGNKANLHSRSVKQHRSVVLWVESERAQSNTTFPTVVVFGGCVVAPNNSHTKVALSWSWGIVCCIWLQTAPSNTVLNTKQFEEGQWPANWKSFVVRQFCGEVYWGWWCVEPISLSLCVYNIHSPQCVMFGTFLMTGKTISEENGAPLSSQYSHTSHTHNVEKKSKGHVGQVSCKAPPQADPVDNTTHCVWCVALIWLGLFCPSHKLARATHLIKHFCPLYTLPPYPKFGQQWRVSRNAIGVVLKKQHSLLCSSSV